MIKFGDLVSLELENEVVNEELKRTFLLSDLTFTVASELYGGTKSNRRVFFTEDDFNQWKETTMNTYGDVTVFLFPEEIT